MSETLHEDLRQRLEAATYDDPSRDLIRFRASENDERVLRLVRELSALSDPDRQLVMAHRGLAEDTIVTFAERRTLAAYREGSLGLALEALDARMVTPRWAFETWRRSALYSCFVAAELGAMTESIVSSGYSIGGEELAAIMRDIVDNLERVSDLSDVGRIEVETDYGVGVLSIPSHRPDGAWWSAFGRGPTLMKPVTATFNSDTNLAAAAARVADALEKVPGVTVHDLVIAELPANVIGGTEFDASVEVVSCLTMNAFSTSAQSDILECYVVELTEADDVTDLVAAITSAETEDPGDFARSAVGRERQLVILMELPVFGADGFDDVDDAVSDARTLAPDSGDPDEPASVDLAPFVDLVAHALTSGH